MGLVCATDELTVGSTAGQRSPGLSPVSASVVAAILALLTTMSPLQDPSDNREYVFGRLQQPNSNVEKGTPQMTALLCTVFELTISPQEGTARYCLATRPQKPSATA